MKTRWLALAARVDALSLRERAILFVSVLLCLLALADVVWLTPAQNRYKTVQQSFITQNAEIARLRTELQAAGRPVDQNQTVRDSTAAAEAEIAGVNQAIATQLALAGAGRALEPVLVQFLRRYDRLTLLGTNTLKDEGPGAGALPSVPGLTRQGLELRIAGPYLELLRFVQNLESALPHLRWGGVQIKAEQQPAQMTLQVYVLGVTP
jgi:MSHA biogenesis protein MshJ